MRMLLQIEMDTETGNQRLADGSMAELMQKVVGKLQPEAAYFYPQLGRRAALFVFELAESSSLVSAVEPFWTELNADVTLVPCMNAEELGAGLAEFLAG